MITGDQEMQVMRTRQSSDSETKLKTNILLIKLLRKPHGETFFKNGS